MRKQTILGGALMLIVGVMFVRVPQMIARQDSVVRTFGALVEVDAVVRQRFVESIESDRLVDGAIRGMLSALDPYSAYLAPDEYEAFQRRQSGRRIGVGVALGLRDGRPTVIAPIEGSPAAAAGILRGDIVLSVDGREVKGLSIFKIESLLTGQIGTHVALGLRRAGQRDPVHVTVDRKSLRRRSVRGFRRDGHGAWDYLIDPEHAVGYVRIADFQADTSDEFDAALDSLLARGCRGLILDLRDNPGGLMGQGIAVADRFIASGTIVSTINRRRVVRAYDATRERTAADIDVVVLVNSGSASASEIVAGALQAHRRATLVGERTFGKGSVQHLIPLADHGGAVKLSVAYYRLPDGRVVHRHANSTVADAWGIQPDLQVLQMPVDQAPPADAPRALSGRILGTLGDRQLEVALELLRQ